MKLSMEQQAQLRRMSRFFEKMEGMADRIDAAEEPEVEEMISSPSPDCDLPEHPRLTISSRRQHVFRSAAHTRENVESSIVNLSVIVNEERF